MDFTLARRGLGAGLLASSLFFLVGALVVSIAGGILAAAKGYSAARTTTLGVSIVIGVTIPVVWTWHALLGIQGTTAFVVFFGGWFLISWLAIWLMKKD